MAALRPHDLRDLLRRRSGELSAQQRLVADYLLEHFDEAPFLTVPELALRSGASEATVVRLAQALGFKGFSALKSRLVDGVRARVIPKPAGPSGHELFTKEPDDDALASVARQEVDNIRRTVAALEREAFHHAALALSKADHVFCFGLGVSSHLAELAAYALTQVGLRATALSPRFSSPLEQLVVARPTDLLMAIAFPPYSRQTVELMREAGRRGLNTVAITDRAASPLARVSRIVLPTPTKNLMHTNSIAAATVVVNALATEIAVKNRRRARATSNQIESLLERGGDVWDDT